MTKDRPVDCLVEIVEVAMSRMNDEHPVDPRESFVLGKITGIACRVPQVAELVKQREEADERAAD